jgi:hypothetical protein
MEFESILFSKGLPQAEFSQKAVIDTHRSITFHNEVRHLSCGAAQRERNFVGFF